SACSPPSKPPGSIPLRHSAMNKFRVPRPCRLVGRLFLSAILIILPGCFQNFGTGGTGERVIPPEQLREIHRTNLDELSAAAPATQHASTQPTTDPTSRPVAERIELSIEQARQWALSNNLDLKVELLNPTIARASLSAEEARFESL